jgi:hypothetical protein
LRDNFFLNNGLKCLQSINIHHLAKNMFKAGLNKGFALVEVYRALFGLADVEAHQASDDTTMVLEIIRFIATYNGKS